MGYAELPDVKEVLRIETGDTTSDTELTNCISSADGLIDAILEFNGFAVPLSSPYPQPVKDASKNFAVWIFRSRDAPPNENQVFFALGMKFLDAYTKAQKDPVVLRA